MLKINLYIFWLSFLLSSCRVHEPLFSETLEDGTIIAAGKKTYNTKEEGSYYMARRIYSTKKIYAEYHINLNDCDKIFKKVVEKKNKKFFDTITVLTNNRTFDYPIPAEDKILFQRMKPYMENINKCYSEFIDKCTGYKILYVNK